MKEERQEINDKLATVTNSFGNTYSTKEFEEGYRLHIAQSGVDGMLYDVTYKKVKLEGMDLWEFQGIDYCIN